MCACVRGCVGAWVRGYVCAWVHAPWWRWRQAREHARDGDDERAYVLYMRWLTFVIECLPQHAAFKSAVAAAQRRALSAEAPRVMDEASRIKRTLLERYREEAGLVRYDI